MSIKMPERIFKDFDKILMRLEYIKDSCISSSKIVEFNEMVKKYFDKIILINITTSRIGHFSMGVEECLRDISLNYNYYLGNKYCVVFVFPENKNDICNFQLYTMVKRIIPVVEDIKLIRILEDLHEFDDDLWDFTNLQKYYYYSSIHDFKKFNSISAQLKFNSEETEKGKKLLNNIGVGKGEFICFHNRDSAYLKSKYQDCDCSYNDYRDSKITNYIDAVESLIEKKGYHAIRMGKKVESNIDIQSEKIIDFTDKNRSDFGDIYLASKCKFFIASSTGMLQVPQMFGVPTVATNLVPFGLIPIGKNDLYIPKKLWYINEKRFLTFKEQIESRIWQWGCNGYNYQKLGIEVIENTKDEIYDISEEMDSRIDRTWIDTDEDVKLQNRVWNLFDKSCIFAYEFKSRIGSKFLKDNEFLIGDRQL